MLDPIIVGVVVLALIVGLWLTRNAKGPTLSSRLSEARKVKASIDPTGDPMDWGEDYKPPPDY